MTFASTNSWGMLAKKLPEAQVPFLKACKKLPPRGKLVMAKMLGPPKQMLPDRADEGMLFRLEGDSLLCIIKYSHTPSLSFFPSFLLSFFHLYFK
jgi:hypothetical protein